MSALMGQTPFTTVPTKYYLIFYCVVTTNYVNPTRSIIIAIPHSINTTSGQSLILLTQLQGNPSFY